MVDLKRALSMGFLSTLKIGEWGLVKKDNIAKEGIRKMRLLDTVAMSNDNSSIHVGRRECGGGARVGVVVVPT